MSREPEQFDLLDWLAAPPPGPAPAASRPETASGSADAVVAPAPVLLIRVDPSCNMRHFHGLTLVTSFWGEWGVMRQWGRIGNLGQRRTDWHDRPAAAELERMERHKRRRGYR